MKETEQKTEQKQGQKTEGQKIEITAARPLNPRSLRLEFSDGSIRLFDSHRLRGPQFIPLLDEKIFEKPVVRDGNLGWEGLDVTANAKYVYDRSVPYDDHAVPVYHEPSKKDILQERIAAILFPIMAAAGIFGIVWWYIHQ